MEKLRIKIGYALQHARERVGMSQKMASEILEIKQSTLAMYETGKNAVSFETAIRMANLYENVSLDYIALRSDNPEMNPNPFRFTFEEE